MIPDVTIIEGATCTLRERERCGVGERGREREKNIKGEREGEKHRGRERERASPQVKILCFKQHSRFQSVVRNRGAVVEVSSDLCSFGTSLRQG